MYGLSDAKNQIKRLLAQWVNGNDQGYVFDLKDHQEQVKQRGQTRYSPLSRDELDKTRPFVFIALGGSSRWINIRRS